MASSGSMDAKESSWALLFMLELRLFPDSELFLAFLNDNI
jgi:hypothetical protein